MKLLMVTILAGLVLVGCKKENPESLFSTEKEIYKINQSVQFTNESINGVEYLWYFGDGESSTLKNPGHTYDKAGEYTVTLRVEGAKKTDPVEYSKKLLIINSNLLNIEPDIIFANTEWNHDSTVVIEETCTGLTNNTTNFLSRSMTFYHDNTMLIENQGGAFLYSYEILNDSTIGLINYQLQGGYYTSIFDIAGNTLTLKSKSLYPCGNGEFAIYTSIEYYNKQ